MAGVGIATTGGREFGGLKRKYINTDHTQVSRVLSLVDCKFKKLLNSAWFHVFTELG